MTILEWPSYRLFPYERRLAIRELLALQPEASPIETFAGVSVDGYLPDVALDQLTYFGRAIDGTQVRIPHQAAIEHASRKAAGRKQVRQSTRFLVHNLHEYKGKFNPQMARSLVNIYGTHADLIIDPYSGSGTTLVEALRVGKSASGLDLNPLAAWLTNVKIQVLSEENPQLLVEEFAALAARAEEESMRAEAPTRADFLSLWTASAVGYLEKWFPPSVLQPMYRVLSLASTQAGLSGELLRMAVSSEVRNCSWQLPEDLRVRRRAATWEPPAYSDVLQVALDRMRISLSELVGGMPERGGTHATAKYGDARHLERSIDASDNRTKAIVTSPPYATALPYIDTDRLSLVALGLAQPEEIRELERDLTGSREWTAQNARSWAQRLESNADRLPVEVVEVCTRIAARNASEGSGFRRNAVPALLYRYFAHMTQAFGSWAEVLKPGEYAVLVVGSNRTGGRLDPIEIDTPKLTAACAMNRGFESVEILPFEIWARYGIHSKNGVPGESAVVLRRE